MGQFFSSTPEVTLPVPPFRVVWRSSGLLLDPFPRQIRLNLQSRVVNDIIDLIALYAQYPSKWLEPSLHWDYVRQTEYYLYHQPSFMLDYLLAGEIHNENIIYFLFFLRLAASQVFLEHRLYNFYEQFSRRADFWTRQITDPLILSLLKLGYQVYQELVPHRPISPLESFYLYYRASGSYHSTTYLKEIVQTNTLITIYHIKHSYFYQTPRHSLVGLVSIWGFKSAEEFYQQVKENYAARPDQRYDPEEFVYLLSQLVEYTHR